MNLVQRIKNLWKLSTLEPESIGNGEVKPGTIFAQLIQKPETVQRAIFFPRIQESPLDRLNKIANES